MSAERPLETDFYLLGRFLRADYVDDNGEVKVIDASFASKVKEYTHLFSQKIIESLLLDKVQKTVAILLQSTPHIDE